MLTLLKSIVGSRWRSMTEAQKHPYKVEAQRTNRKLRQRMSSANPEQLLVRHEMWLQRAAVDESSQTSPSHLPCIVLVHYLGDDAFQMLTVPPRPIRVRPPAVRAPGSQGPTDTLSSSCSIGSVQLQLQCLPVTVLAESSEGEEMHEEERGVDEEDAVGEGLNAPSFDNAETHKHTLVLSSSPRMQYPMLATSEPPILAQVVHVPTPVHVPLPSGGFVLRERPAPLAACSPGSMLLQPPLMLQAKARSASQNNLDDLSASAAGVANGPADEACVQPSDADTFDAPVSPTSPTSPTGSELKNECAYSPQFASHQILTQRLTLCIVAEPLALAQELARPPPRTSLSRRSSLHATCFLPEVRATRGSILLSLSCVAFEVDEPKHEFSLCGAQSLLEGCVVSRGTDGVRTTTEFVCVWSTVCWKCVRCDVEGEFVDVLYCIVTQVCV